MDETFILNLQKPGHSKTESHSDRNQMKERVISQLEENNIPKNELLLFYKKIDEKYTV